jgi:rubrerythrin
MEWLVECPRCGTFVQTQKTDPTCCPKCHATEIDTTPLESGGETVCCEHCGHEYDRHVGDQCPNCGHIKKKST